MNEEGYVWQMRSPKISAETWTAFYLVLKAIGAWDTLDRSRSFPCSPPIRVSLKFGATSSPSIPRCNPRFQEFLMGQPPGWTDPGAPVTGFARWLRRSRGALCALTSEFETEPASTSPA